MRKFTYPILVALVTAGFYIWENYLDKKEHSEFVEETKSNGSNSDFDYLPTSTTDQVVAHAYYSLSYSEKHEQPEWVAYELKKEHTAYNDFKRPYFEVDPLVKGNSASWRNYKNSGYDRGHMCPAADRKFNKKAHDETFLTSNISPQKHKFNAGIWNDLEQKVRYWVKKENRLFVVTGPVFGNSTKTIGSEGVTVPEKFFKIVLDYDAGNSKMIGFVIPHNTSSRNLKEFVIPVDEIESLLDIDFFAALPDDLENKLEGSKGKGWKF